VISMCSSAISMPSNDRRSSAINAARGTMMRRFMFSPPEEEVEQINQGSGEGGCHAPTDPHDALADRTQVPVHTLSPLLQVLDALVMTGDVLVQMGDTLIQRRHPSPLHV